jgi:hypothetical protein
MDYNLVVFILIYFQLLNLFYIMIDFEQTK